MKTAISGAGKLAGTFVLALALVGCTYPAGSPPAPDTMRKGMDARGGTGGRGKRGRQRFRRGPGGVTLDGQATIDVLDKETLCGIGRQKGCTRDQSRSR